MKRFLQIIGAIALLSIMGFSMFGFLASFEFGDVNGFHMVYGFIGILSLTGAAWLIFPQYLTTKKFIFFKTVACATPIFFVAVTLFWVWARWR